MMKKVVMVTATATLLMLLVYQGSMAFFHADTTVGTKISSGTLGIELVQTSHDEKAAKTNNGYQFTSVMPGTKLDGSTHVQNIKEYSVYVRVTAEKYWIDQKGQKLVDADASLINLYTTNPENWIIIDDAKNSNSEIVYYYYKLPVKSQESTTNFLDQIEISTKLQDDTYTDYQVSVKLTADAVQSIQGVDASMSEWGVEMKTDAKGTILTIEE